MNLKKIFLAIGIALLFTIFIGYGVEVFNETPHNECYETFGEKPRDVQTDIEQSNLYDTAEFKQCLEEYEIIRDKTELINMIVLVSFGVLGLILGIVLLKFEGIGAGFMGGSIMLIIYGVLRYWSQFGKYTRLSLLGAALAFLVWLGYKKIENKS
jgi:vacuolar-type H+-ATPase subunit I/STV1|tara:strand:- start:530 stop:994 length:465 start_codon:yes stop_codon:yes gene_type:complete